MARAPKTTAAKPHAKPHAAKPAEAAPQAAKPDDAPDAPPQEAEPLPAADPTREPYTGPISPTPLHLIRMTHPGGGRSDGFQQDESGAILVPHAQVVAMEGHGFVVDHLPQPAPEADDDEIV